MLLMICVFTVVSLLYVAYKATGFLFKGLLAEELVSLERLFLQFFIFEKKKCSAILQNPIAARLNEI